MKQAGYAIFLIAAVLLLFSGCMGERGGDGGAGSAISQGVKVKSVFPRSPVVLVNGSLQLTAIVTNASEVTLQSTQDDPVTVSWSSDDPEIASFVGADGSGVSDSGIVVGNTEGRTTLRLTASYGNMTSVEYTVNIEVVNVNTHDVAEIYLSPDRAYIDLTAQRTFDLTVVDYQGAPTSLSQGTVTFDLEGQDADSVVSVTPEQINSTDTEKKVTVTGLSKGYAFVVPVYSFANDDNSTTIKVTGTPLVVQVKDKADTSKPDDTTVVAGNYLDVAVREKDGRKIIHVVQYDEDRGKPYYSYFDGTWEHTFETFPYGGKSPVLVLSPFIINNDETYLNQPVVLMLENDNRPVVWYQNSRNLWDFVQLTEDPILDENGSFGDEEKFLGLAVHNAPDGNASANAIHAIYYDQANLELCLVSFSGPRTISQSGCITDLPGELESLSIDVNHISGEPRFAYVVKEGNATDAEDAGIYYATRQSGGLYNEKLPKTTGIEKGVVLRLDSNNVPMLMYRTNYKIGVAQRTYNLESGTYRWAVGDINLDPIPTGVDSLDFAFDAYNAPRVVFNTDGDIRYARQLTYDKNRKFAVEAPEDSAIGELGYYSAIAVDEENRAHIVYKVDDDLWFNYWAEPNFFDYRVYPDVEYLEADIIRN